MRLNDVNKYELKNNDKRFKGLLSLIGTYINGHEIISIIYDPFNKNQLDLITDSFITDEFGDKIQVIYRITYHKEWFI